jgi:hypothetical protein
VDWVDIKAYSIRLNIKNEEMVKIKVLKLGVCGSPIAWGKSEIRLIRIVKLFWLIPFSLAIWPLSPMHLPTKILKKPQKGSHLCLKIISVGRLIQDGRLETSTILTL